MKYKLVILFGICFLTIVVKSNCQLSEDNLRVMTYNIWNGFEWGKDTLRKQNLVSWVKTQKPDVFALQELCGFDSLSLAHMAAQWEHTFVTILKTGGYPVGITSRYPIRLQERIRTGMHHGALHVQIGNIHYFVIHFSPSSFVKRREEAVRIIGRIKQLPDSTQVMVLGDFNALSPLDANLYPEDSPVLKRYRNKHPERDLGNLEDMKFDYATIASFLAYPLYDLAFLNHKDDSNRGTFPATALAKANQESHQSLQARQQRIDYIFTSRFLANSCISARVIKDQFTHKLSDHYPVIAVFGIVKPVPKK